MKELSIEEKAKRYDRALEKLRSLHDNYDTISTLIDIKEELEHILPELKESEDERIRKGLIGYFLAGKCENISSYHGISTNDILAWLEKQGEQKPAEDSCKNSDDITTEEKDRTEYKKGFECGKQRVLKYPEDFGLCKKIAWSEEDKRILYNIKEYVNLASGQKGVSERMLKEAQDWLKSIKERYAWKPSDEQLNALSKAIAFVFDSNSDVKHTLESLYNELKKLFY